MPALCNSERSLLCCSIFASSRVESRFSKIPKKNLPRESDQFRSKAIRLGKNSLAKTSIADPNHFVADIFFHFDAYPDSTFHFNEDPNPIFHFDADLYHAPQ